MDLIHLAGTVALWTCALSSTGFCVTYHVTARWWRSAEGVHLMTFTGALAVIFGWLAYRNLTVPPAPGATTAEEITRSVVYTTVGVLLLWRLALLWSRQIHPALKRSRKDSNEPAS